MRGRADEPGTGCNFDVHGLRVRTLKDGHEILRIARSAERKARGHPEWADLVQEAALAVLEHPDEPHPVYLARRTAWNAWRRLRRRGSARARVDFDRLESPAEHEWPDSLASMLAGLTDAEFNSVVLICGLDGSGGRSFGEVAWMLGRNQGSVRHRYNAGLAKIRALLSARERIHE